MQHLKLAAVCLVLGAACTVENPLYTPGAVEDLARSSTDGSAMTGVDQGGPPTKTDLSMPVVACTGDQRGCSMTGSEGCVGGVLVEDRVCPNASTCASGHCGAPAPASNNVGRSCAPTGAPTESLCVAGLGGGSTGSVPSCEPFIDPALPTTNKVAWVCASRIGMGLPGQPCTSGAMCRTGFCGDNGTCFRACITPADCPTQGGNSWKCEVVSIVVEGSTIMASSCVL